jgi:hypothetical protein
LLAGAVALLVSGIKYYNKSKTVRNYQVLISEFRQVSKTPRQVFQGLLVESGGVQQNPSFPDARCWIPTLANRPACQGCGATPGKPTAKK